MRRGRRSSGKLRTTYVQNFKHALQVIALEALIWQTLDQLETLSQRAGRSRLPLPPPLLALRPPAPSPDRVVASDPEPGLGPPPAAHAAARGADPVAPSAADPQLQDRPLDNSFEDVHGVEERTVSGSGRASPRGAQTAQKGIRVGAGTGSGLGSAGLDGGDSGLEGSEAADGGGGVYPRLRRAQRLVYQLSSLLVDTFDVAEGRQVRIVAPARKAKLFPMCCLTLTPALLMPVHFCWTVGVSFWELHCCFAELWQSVICFLPC